MEIMQRRKIVAEFFLFSNYAYYMMRKIIGFFMQPFFLPSPRFRSRMVTKAKIRIPWKYFGTP